MNTALKKTQKQSLDQIDNVLRKVLTEAEREHRNLQKMFELMGWGNLPDRLKMEIKDDVSAMVDELKGQYSSCDPFVEQRRKTVTYWVNCFTDGICSLDAAVKAVKVRSL